MITIGVAQWVLDRSGPPALARARELGFAAVHLDAGAPGDAHHVADRATVRAYRRASTAHGLVVAAIAANGIEAIGMLESTERADRCRDIVHAAIDAAAELRAPIVYVPSFRRCEIRDRKDLSRTADFLRGACERAASSGLGIASENTLGAAGNERLFAEVHSARLSLLVDHANAVLWGHDPLELIDAMRERMCGQLHTKDGANGVMGNRALGEGDARFEQTCARLVANDFHGYVICENDYSVDAERRSARDRAALSRHLGTLLARSSASRSVQRDAGGR